MKQQLRDNLVARMVALGLAGAIIMALGRYCNFVGNPYIPAINAIGEFLITIAWLLIAGTIAVIVIWGLKTARS